MTKRIEWLDWLKFFLIVLVVWGHLLAYVSDKQYLLPEWGVIYSFHMPLFIYLSGYVFKYKEDVLTFFRNRIAQLLLPGLTCAVIVSATKFASYGIDIKRTIEAAILNMWFLKALFLCYLVAYSYKYYKKTCVIICVGLYLLLRTGLWNYTIINRVDVINMFVLSISGYNGFIYLLPFFILGATHELPQLQEKVKLWGGVLIFVIMELSFSGCRSAYFASPIWLESYHVNYHEVFNALYRIVLGVVGIMLFTSIFCHIHTIFNQRISQAISSIGQQTLGIYILQYLVVEQNMFQLPYHALCQNRMIIPLLAIFMVLILYGLICLIHKNKVLSTLLIGR